MLCKQAWNLCEDLFVQMKQHPFNAGLKNGTLDSAKFHCYIQQDSLYLIDFARVLASAAAKAEKSSHINKLLGFAKDAIAMEQDMHKSFNINFDTKKSTACFVYTNFLLAVAGTGSLIETLAAVLPCFWYYQELGSYMKKDVAKSNPYASWIDLYSSKEIEEITKSFIKLVNELSKDIAPNSYLEKRFLENFRKSAELEIFFWNDAYNYNQKKLC
jgi:thiaminase (transcriptional activator TenA)